LNVNKFFLYTLPLSPPNNVAKRFVDVYLFPTLKKGKGRLPFMTGERRIHN